MAYLNHSLMALFALIVIACTMAVDGTFVSSIPLVQTASVALMKATPDALVTSGDNVTIAWSNVPEPTKYDVLLIYSPAVPLNTTNMTGLPFALGFWNVSTFVNWESGAGVLTIPLVNPRTNYSFQYVSSINATVNGTTSYTLQPLVNSNSVSFQNVNEALQPRLALTADPTQMRLMYTTASDSQTPTVKYWAGGGNSSDAFVATGTSSTYTIEDMCTYPANDPLYFKDPGYFHDVLMTNLTASAMYSYVFGNDVEGWSSTHTFYAAPPVGVDGINIFAFGDLGTLPPFALLEEDEQMPSIDTCINIANELTSLQAPSMVLHVGDISYARGQAFIWDWFQEQIAPISSQVPWMVNIGNHEYDYTGQPFHPAGSNYGTDSGGECGVPYGNRFNMPSAPGFNDTMRNLWFSFDYGPVHFVSMSTEHNFLNSSAQYQFLLNDLQNVDRSVTPWIVFSGHRPMYTSMLDTGENGLHQTMRDIYEPLFQQYHVDMALWGHVHTYERTCGMISNYTCAANDNDGTVHVVIGMAGNTFQTNWLEYPPYSGEQIQPDWSVFRAIDYGYTRIFANTTHFNLEFVSNHRVQVHDSVWLEK